MYNFSSYDFEGAEVNVGTSDDTVDNNENFNAFKLDTQQICHLGFNIVLFDLFCSFFIG